MVTRGSDPHSVRHLFAARLQLGWQGRGESPGGSFPAWLDQEAPRPGARFFRRFAARKCRLRMPCRSSPSEFASDNTARFVQQAALCRRIQDSGLPMGDRWTTTRRAGARFLETDARPFSSSTAPPNALALAQICNPFASVLRCAHIETDECGAGAFRRRRLLPVGGETVRLSRKRRSGHGATPRCAFDQGARPRYHPGDRAGTVYSLTNECDYDFARRHSLTLHMDGARFVTRWHR